MARSSLDIRPKRTLRRHLCLFADNCFAQVSMEYLLIIGFALVLTIPVLLIFFSQSSDMSDRVNVNQASRVAKELVDAAEKIYFIGEPSQTKVKVTIPDNVEVISFSNKELQLKVRIVGGLTDVYQVSLVNITGNISTVPGTKTILIRAQNGFANLTEV